jgi:hypothetical protein
MEHIHGEQVIVFVNEKSLKNSKSLTGEDVDRKRGGSNPPPCTKGEN